MKEWLLIVFLWLPLSFCTVSFKIAVVIENNLVNHDSIINLVQKRINSNWRLNTVNGPIIMTVRVINATNCKATQVSLMVCSETGFSHIVVVGSCSLINNMLALSQSLQMPIIAVPTDFCDITVSSALAVIHREPLDKYVSTVVAVFASKNTEHVAIMFDKYQSLQMIQSLQDELTKKDITTVTYEFDSTSQVLPRFIKGTVHNVLIIARPENVIKILNQARTAKTLQENYYWAVFDTGLSPADLLAVLEPKTMFSNILLIRSNSNGFMSQSVSFCKESVSDVIPSCNPATVHTVEYRTLDAIEAVGYTLSKLVNTSSYVLSNASCSPWQPWFSGFSAAAIMSTITNLNTFRTVISYNSSTKYLENKYIETVGTFTAVNGQFTHFLESGKFNYATGKLTIVFKTRNRSLVFPNTFISFKNRTLRACTVPVSGFGLHPSKNPDGTVVNVGLVADIVKIFMKHLDFHVEYRTPPDGYFGGPVVGQKYYSGCIGELQKGNADLASPFAVTTVRSLAMDYTQDYMQSSNAMIVKRPVRGSKLWNVFVPLSESVWILLVVVLFATATIVFLLAKFSPFTAWNLGLPYAIADEVWLQEYLWSVVGSFLQQGQDFYPFAMSPRTVLAFWWLFTVIIFGAYTGDLTAHLTITKTVYPIQELDELVDNPQYKALMAKDSNLHILIAAQTEGLYYKLQKQWVLAPSITSCAEQVVQTTDPYQVCLTDLGVLKNFANTYCQDIYLANARFNIYNLAFGVPLDSYYKNELDFILTKMKDTGLSDALVNKHFPTNGDCLFEDVSTEADPIDLEGIGGTCILLAVLYICGFVLLGLELVWSRLLKKQPLELFIY